jgi:hypothetical protein
MRTERHGTQLTAVVLIFSLLCLFLPTSPAMAGWIRTEAALDGPQARLVSVLERTEIAAALSDLGVDPQEARRRAAGLTDEEARLALERVESMPAGGLIGEVVAAVLIVFLVLLLTDILGFTDVFPFVKKTVR